MFVVVNTWEWPCAVEPVLTSTPFVISSEAFRYWKLCSIDFAHRIPVRSQNLQSIYKPNLGWSCHSRRQKDDRNLTHWSLTFSRSSFSPGFILMALQWLDFTAFWASVCTVSVRQIFSLPFLLIFRRSIWWTISVLFILSFSHTLPLKTSAQY